MDIRGGHTDHLRVRAVDRQSEDVERAVLRAFVGSPVERWIDDDVASLPRGVDVVANLDDLSGAIRSRNDRHLDARILSLANPDVTAIQCGGTETDHDISRAGSRIRTLFEAKVLGITNGIEHDCAHNRVL